MYPFDLKVGIPQIMNSHFLVNNWPYLLKWLSKNQVTIF